jgi:signal peptidase I
MEPTLTVGQRVLADRISPRFSDPGRGDIVVFKPPRGADDNAPVLCLKNDPGAPCAVATKERSDTNFIKRVVGLPGDHLKVIAGRVYIDGKRQNEPFIRPDAECPTCNLPREITIPPGHFFMMGDNRGNSTDSRVWGPVPKKWIIGGAFFTYWPPKRIGVP